MPNRTFSILTATLRRPRNRRANRIPPAQPLDSGAGQSLEARRCRKIFLTCSSCRVCPGRYFADDTLFLTIASLLHLFRISNVEGATGRDVVRNVHWSSGLVRFVGAFLDL